MRVYALLLLLAVGCRGELESPPPVVPAVVARFDPLASPPVIPLPNDLALVNGHPAIPDLPTDSPAQRELNAYLRTLDGFPPDSTATAAFTAPLDPSTARPPGTDAAGSALVFDLTAATLLSDGQLHVSVSADGLTLQIVPAKRWKSGHTFAILLFGGSDPNGLRGANGDPVLASPAFFFLRAPKPLVDPAGQPTVFGLDAAMAQMIEPARAQLDRLLAPLFATPPLQTRRRADLALAWAFTISSLPTAVLDPTRGDLPFPNDALIDPATGLVSLPVTPGDPMAALKAQLNTLDGFSVSAPETLPIDVPDGDAIDPATVKSGATAILAPVDGAEPPTYAAAPVTTGPDRAFAGLVAVQPLVALVPDQRRYAVVVTRDVADQRGRPLEPPPLGVLLAGAAPLFDGMHSTVSVLDDAEAAQLERLRQAEQPLFDRLASLGLPRERIAAAWTFTTQSIKRPLDALDHFPTAAGVPTGVTLDTFAGAALLAQQQAMLPFSVENLSAIALGTFTSAGVIDPATQRVLFTRAADQFTVQPPPGAPMPAIRFWLSLPKAPPAGASAAPVVILQHGLQAWRGEMVVLADGFARQGWAAIAFDIDLHGARSTGTLQPAPVTPADPLACALEPLSGNPIDCRPTTSGAGFLDPSNLFASKSNVQQFVVDAAQLVRVLSAGGTGSLADRLARMGAPIAIDGRRPAFLGHSLGGIGGASFLAAASEPRVAVLNAAGAHIFEIVANGGYRGVIDQLLQQLGIARDSVAYLQLQATADWVLDPIDPFAVARFVRQPIIVQEPGMDATIPPIYQEALAFALLGPTGLDQSHHAQGRQLDGSLVSTFFPASAHSTLITLVPDAAEGEAMRVQAATFIATGGASLPPPR
jgi:hypothetical protein